VKYQKKITIIIVIVNAKIHACVMLINVSVKIFVFVLNCVNVILNVNVVDLVIVSQNVLVMETIILLLKKYYQMIVISMTNYAYKSNHQQNHVYQNCQFVDYFYVE